MWLGGRSVAGDEHGDAAGGEVRYWRAWFGRGHNRTAFLDYYEIPPDVARRQLAPRYVPIHGRRDNFESVPRRREKRAELVRPDERLMSFDRLTPNAIDLRGFGSLSWDVTSMACVSPWWRCPALVRRVAGVDRLE